MTLGCAAVPLHNEDGNTFPGEIDMDQKRHGAKQWLQGRGVPPNNDPPVPHSGDSPASGTRLPGSNSGSKWLDLFDLRASYLHCYASVSSLQKRDNTRT